MKNGSFDIVNKQQTEGKRLTQPVDIMSDVQ